MHMQAAVGAAGMQAVAAAVQRARRHAQGSRNRRLRGDTARLGACVAESACAACDLHQHPGAVHAIPGARGAYAIKYFTCCESGAPVQIRVRSPCDVAMLSAVCDLFAGAERRQGHGGATPSAGCSPCWLPTLPAWSPCACARGRAAQQQHPQRTCQRRRLACHRTPPGCRAWHTVLR
jgi:hypothetical protein